MSCFLCFVSICMIIVSNECVLQNRIQLLIILTSCSSDPSEPWIQTQRGESCELHHYLKFPHIPNHSYTTNWNYQLYCRKSTARCRCNNTTEMNIIFYTSINWGSIFNKGSYVTDVHTCVHISRMSIHMSKQLSNNNSRKKLLIYFLNSRGSQRKNQLWDPFHNYELHRGCVRSCYDVRGTQCTWVQYLVFKFAWISI